MIETRSAPQIWATALSELQIQVNKSNYHTWLAKTTGLDYQNGQFIVGVPSTFIAEYLDKNQRILIERVLTGIISREARVVFQVVANQPDQPSSYRHTGKSFSVQQASLPLFNPRYTFGSFVVGSGNQLAYAAAQEVARNPGHSHNPLFIFGGSGLGKTHLLQAIGNAALTNHTNALYIRAEEYTNQLVKALKEKKTDEFRSKYRSVDLLLVDDVEFFCGKTQTAENFFHTFDELYCADHQIALVSDRPPKSLPFLQGRLRSRFEGGLVTDIEPPDFETRLAILQAKAKQKDAVVSDDVLELIALQIQQNIRALEGSLNRVIAYAKLVHSMVTPRLAAQALKDIADAKPSPAPVMPHLIIEAVVTKFEVTPSDLKGRKRDEITALARQVAMYLMRQETDRSLADIGRELGGRTPATVSHAYQKIANDLNSSPHLRRKVFEIQQELAAGSRNYGEPL